MALKIAPRQRFCPHGRSARMPLRPPVVLTVAREGDSWYLTCSACHDWPVTKAESRVDAVDWAMGHRRGTHQAETLVGFEIDT